MGLWLSVWWDSGTLTECLVGALSDSIGVNVTAFRWEILLSPLDPAYPLFGRNISLICNFQKQKSKIDLLFVAQ